MLKILDVLIGVATVMLLFSMVVTLITQSILTAIGSRGRNLKNGLAGLLKQLDATLPDNVAHNIAEVVLKHPMVVGQWGALGSVIHRDELTTLLMELAAGESPKQLQGATKTALVNLLKNNGIDDPSGALKNIRDVALQLEVADPTLTNSVRHGLAIVQEAKSEYVAKIHGWFDQTIDRGSQRFTANAHAIAFVVGLVVAFAVQVDTIALVNRLASDDAVRAAVTDKAKTILQNAGQSSAITGSDQHDGSSNPKPGAQQPSASPAPSSPTVPSKSKKGSTPPSAGSNADKSGSQVPASSPPSPVPGVSSSPTATLDSTVTPAPSPSTTPRPTPDAQQQLYNLLDQNGLIVLPGGKWQFPVGNKLLGIFISALLLALGAPFWYKALQSLLKLKSIIAQKDDQQRQARQSGSTEDGAAPATAKNGGGGSTTALPPAFQGEQGDLKAVG